MTKEKIHTIIREYFADKPVKKVSVFGSYVTKTQDRDSDLDILIDLKHPVGLMKLSQYKNELEELLGIPIDIGTSSGLSKYVATEVREAAELVYEA